MTPVEGVDYSVARPSPSVLRRLGKRFAVRYLSYSNNGKNLTRAEAERLWREGIVTILVWETTADMALSGRVGGNAHAQAAVEQARRLGAPPNVVIYFAVDFNPTTAQVSTVNAYFDGVQEVIPFNRVGVYGGLRTMVEALRLGWGRYLWQTYAWSGGVWHKAACAQQYRNGVSIDGQDCDLDRAMTDYIGQWDGDGIVPGWEMDEMTPAEKKNAWFAQCRLNGLMRMEDPIRILVNPDAGVNTERTEPNPLAAAIRELREQAQQTPGDVQVDALAAELLDRMRAELLAILSAGSVGKAVAGGPTDVPGV